VDNYPPGRPFTDAPPDNGETMSESLLERINRYLPVALPGPHFMAFAPLDVWFRLLTSPPTFIRPKHWLQLVANLLTSTIGTAITLPERLTLAPILKHKYKTTSGQLKPPPNNDLTALIILGYFRTGTTHLQYLLSADPQYTTPRWVHALAPQGFVLSWTFLRLFLLPFMSEQRPQDQVAYGPEWPAEDDFGVNNWSLASSLPSRFIIPNQLSHYQRYHDLNKLSPKEYERWRRYQWSFLHKLQLAAPNRTLLLKSPSHTARVSDLMNLFGPDHVKFIHINRNHDEVIRSNIGMARRLSGFLLQHPPSPTEIRKRIIEEYIATEQQYLRDRENIPEGHLTELHYEDLRDHPLQSIRSAYNELNIPWSETFEGKARAYLHTTRDYKPNIHPQQPVHLTDQDPSKWAEQLTNISKQLFHSQWHRFSTCASDAKRSDFCKPVQSDETVSKQLATPDKYNRPTSQVDQNDHPPSLPRAESRGEGGLQGGESCESIISASVTRQRWALFTAIITAILSVMIWITAARFLGNRYDSAIWPIGILIGYTALRTAKTGSVKLGVFASVLTLTVLLAVCIPNTQNTYYINHPNIPFRDIFQTTRLELLSGHTLFWTFMGIVSAYRFGSRTRFNPSPG